MRIFEYNDQALRRTADSLTGDTNVLAIYNRPLAGGRGIWSRGNNWEEKIQSLCPVENDFQKTLLNLDFNDNSVFLMGVWSTLGCGERSDISLANYFMPSINENVAFLHAKLLFNTLYRGFNATGRAAFYFVGVAIYFDRDPRDVRVQQLAKIEESKQAESKQAESEQAEKTEHEKIELNNPDFDRVRSEINNLVRPLFCEFLSHFCTQFHDEFSLSVFIAYFCKKLNEKLKPMKVHSASVTKFEVVPGQKLDQHLIYAAELFDQSVCKIKVMPEVSTILEQAGIIEFKEPDLLSKEQKSVIDNLFHVIGSPKNRKIFSNFFDGFKLSDEKRRNLHLSHLSIYIKKLADRMRLLPLQDLLIFLRRNLGRFSDIQLINLPSVLYLAADMQDELASLAKEKGDWYTRHIDKPELIVSCAHLCLASVNWRIEALEQEAERIRDLVIPHVSIFYFDPALIVVLLQLNSLMHVDETYVDCKETVEKLLQSCFRYAKNLDDTAKQYLKSKLLAIFQVETRHQEELEGLIQWLAEYRKHRHVTWQDQPPSMVKK